jgi:hypothetical protein
MSPTARILFRIVASVALSSSAAWGQAGSEWPAYGGDLAAT